MAKKQFILLAEGNGWSLATWPATPNGNVLISAEKGAPIVQTADAIVAALKSRGHTDEPLAICIPSSWCMSASITTNDLPAGDQQAKLYRLEEHLPIAAENIVADFISGPSGEATALAVCVPISSIAPLVQSLEQAGVAVQSILPTALATAQQLAQAVNEPAWLLLCGEAGTAGSDLSTIVLQNHKPTEWALIPRTVDDLKLQLELISVKSGRLPLIKAVDIAPTLLKTLSQAIGQAIDPVHEAGSIAATRCAAEVLLGNVAPWAEFRRDKLAAGDSLRLFRRSIDRCLVAVIILFLSLTTAFLWRAHRYHRVDRTATDNMLIAFREHYPGWEIPINVRAVVDAQYRQAHDDADVASAKLGGRSALVTLHDVLTPMVAQEHFQIERMAFHSNSFEISGRLASYEQIDVLAKTARGAGMTLLPAQTRKNADNTWTFSLQGTLLSAAAKD